MNKKGFTLIELLAVIVILAIIALIATPIVLNIINDSRESSTKISAENYLKALENSIAQAPLQNIKLEDGFYRIMEDGNICSGTIEQKQCSGTMLKVDISGDIPKKGNLTLDKGQVVRSSLVYNTSTIETDFDGNVEYLPFAKEYEIGQIIQANESEPAFYVIGEDANNVELLFSSTLTQRNSTYDWISTTDCKTLTNGAYTSNIGCTHVGPYTMLKKSYNLGFPTEYFLPITSYEYENNKVINDTFSYKKYEIDNQTIKITTASGEVLSQTVGDTYLRFLSAEEILELASIYNKNLRYENLRELLNKHIDKVNEFFVSLGVFDVNTRAKDINELLDMLNMDNDWKTMASFAAYALSVLSLEQDLTSLALPQFFGNNENETWSWWTLSSAKLAIFNSTIMVRCETGNCFLTMNDRTTTNGDDEGYKPVVKVSKETLRKTLN